MDAQTSTAANRQALLAGIAIAVVAGVAILALALRSPDDSVGKGPKTTAKERVLGVTVTRDAKSASAKKNPTSTTATTAAPATTASPFGSTVANQSLGSTGSSVTPAVGGSTVAGGGTTQTTIITSFETVPTTAAPRRAAGRVVEVADNTVGFDTRPQSGGADIGTSLTYERQDPNWFNFTIDAPARNGGVVLTAVLRNTNEQALIFPGGLSIVFNLRGSNGAIQSYTVSDPSITQIDAFTQLQVEQFITLTPDDYLMDANTTVEYQ